MGFAVVKLRVGEASYFLMRFNPKWKDLNFIGGHEKPRDAGDLRTTARRELWEEVPSVRPYVEFDLKALGPEVQYGPVFSKSRGEQVEYNVQFFLVLMAASPIQLVESLSWRSKNVWVSEDELIDPQQYRLSGLVRVLSTIVPAGLKGIDYSSECDLRLLETRFTHSDLKQLSFAFK